MNVIYRANDNVVQLSSLANGLTGALLGSATVTVTLQDATGTAVTATGISWPLTMVAASGATGTYRATLPYTMTLTTGTTYYAAISADGGAGLVGAWTVPVRATTRAA